jgi:hypothetical protein
MGYIICPIVIMEALRSKHFVDKKAAGSSVVGSKLPQSERRVEIVPGVYVGREFTIPEVSSEDQSLSFRAKHLGENKDTAQDLPDMSPEAQMARYQAAMGNKSGMPSEDMSPEAQMARYQAAMGNKSGMPSEAQKQTPEASAKSEKAPKKRRSAKPVIPQAPVSVSDATPVEKAKQTFENEATRVWKATENPNKTNRYEITAEEAKKGIVEKGDLLAKMEELGQLDPGHGDLLKKMERDGMITRTDKTGLKTKSKAEPVPAPDSGATEKPKLTKIDNKGLEAKAEPVSAKPVVPQSPVSVSDAIPVESAKETNEGKAGKEEVGEESKQKTEAETPEQHIARIEKEIADKIDQKTEEKRRSGKGKIMGGEKLAIAQEVYMRELKGYSIEEMPGFRGEFGRFFAFLSGREKVKVVDNNAKDKDGKPLVKKIVKRNWMLHDPSQELVDTLKSEFENEARKVKEEVVPQQVSEIAQKPASPEVITEETTVAEEASSEDLRDSARQYDDYLVALKYTPERGGDGLMRLRSNEKGDNEKGDNEKGEYAIDKETGKPFEFEKFSEANKFLKKKLEQKNAPQNLTEMMEDKTPAEKTKEEVLV